MGLRAGGVAEKGEPGDHSVGHGRMTVSMDMGEKWWDLR